MGKLFLITRGRVAVLCLAALLVLGLGAIVPHYLSGYLTDYLRVELAKTFGPNARIGRAYVSFLPLKIGIRDLEIKDSTGHRTAGIGEIEAHLRILPLIAKHLVIQKAFINNITIDMDRQYVDDMVKKLGSGTKSSAAASKKSAFALDVLSFALTSGNFAFRDGAKAYDLSLKNLQARIRYGFDGLELKMEEAAFGYTGPKKLLSDKVRVKQLSLDLKRDGAKEDSFTLNSFTFINEGIKIKATGASKGLTHIVIKPDISVDMDYLKKLLSLKNKGGTMVSITGEATYNGKDIDTDLAVKGSVHLETLMELIGEKEPLRGETTVEGTVKGPLKDLHAQAKAVLKKGSLYDVAVDELTCTVKYEDRKLKFVNGAASLYKGTASAEATLNMPVVNYFDVKIDVFKVDSEAVFRLIGFDPGFAHGKISGSLISKGKVFNPEVRFDYHKVPAPHKQENNTRTNQTKNSNHQTAHNNHQAAKAQQDQATAPAPDVFSRVQEAKGRVYMKDKAVTLYDIAVATEHTDALIKGTVSIDSGTLDLKGQVATKDILDLTMPYSSDFTGKGRFTGTVAGTVKKPAIAGTVELDEGSLFDIRFSSLKAPVYYALEKLTIGKATATLYGGRSTFEGTMAFENPRKIFDFHNPMANFTASIRDLQVYEALNGYFHVNENIRALLDSDFTIKGPASTLNYEGTIKARSLSLYGMKVDRADSPFTFTKGKVSFRGLKTAWGGSSLVSDAAVTVQGKENTYEVSTRECLVKAQDTPLAAYVGNEASLKCTVKGKGTFKEPRFDLEALMEGAKIKGTALGRSRIAARMDGRKAELSGEFFQNMISIKGTAALGPAMSWTAQASLRQGSYDFLLSGLLKNSAPGMHLSMAGDISLTGTRSSINGKVQMPFLKLSAYDYSFHNQSDIVMSLKDNTLSLDSFAMSDGTNTVKAAGGMTFGKSYALTLKGGVNLKTFQALSDRISLLNGMASVGLSVNGPWEKPAIHGDLTVRGGTLGLKNFGYYFNNVDGIVKFDQNKVIVEQLTSKVAGGGVDIKGVGYLEGFKISKFSLEGKLRSIPVHPSEEFKLRFGADLLYAGTLTSQTLSGDVTIDKGLYSQGIYVMDFLLSKKGTKQSTEGDALRHTNLNLNVIGDKDIQIKNNVARTQVRLNLMVRGTVGSPLLYGRMESNEGKVFLNMKEYKISHASVFFTGEKEINPYLNVAAETATQGYQVRLIVDGRMKNLRLGLSSSPPLDQESILKLLSSGGGSAAGVASLLGGKYQKVIEDRIKGLTGFSMSLTGDQGQADGSNASTSPQVTLSRELVEDKLFLTLSSVGSSGGQAVKLEYLVNKHVAVQGMRDKTGSVGGDIKFRFEFK